MHTPGASSLLTRTPVLLDQGPTLVTSFNLNSSLKAPSPKIVTLWSNTSTYESGGDMIQCQFSFKKKIYSRLIEDLDVKDKTLKLIKSEHRHKATVFRHWTSGSTGQQSLREWKLMK